jgi:thiol-disulfide isomerase/thioredoxin
MMKPIKLENYNQNYTAYVPNKEVLNRLSPLSKGINITAVIGTWCSDSKLYVPQFYKILDAIGFAEPNLTLIEVDEEKKSTNNATNHLNIISVPTFIIFKNGQELGRIIESPLQTFEHDLLNILKTHY